MCGNVLHTLAPLPCQPFWERDSAYETGGRKNADEGSWTAFPGPLHDWFLIVPSLPTQLA